MTSFIHLRNHSSFSLLEGAIKVKDLIKLAEKHHMPALALTDSGNLYGALEFALAAKKSGIQPIIGCQINFVALHQDKPHEVQSDQLVLLAQNETGYKNLLKIVSGSFTDCGLPFPCVNIDALEKHNAGLIVLSGGSKGPLARLILNRQKELADEVCQKLYTIFGDRFYIELQRHFRRDEEQSEKGLIALAYKYNIPLVATNEVFFNTPDMYDAHDALLCIAGGRYVVEDERRKETPEHYFKSADEMARLFDDIPEAIHNTVLIARRCSYAPQASEPLLPKFPTLAGQSEDAMLRQLASDGLQKRMAALIKPEMNADARDHLIKPYQERLEYELGVIIQMGFPGYFLIVADFIQWAKAQNIPVGPGRGSGAGSVVAWALTITDLDPLAFGLLLERFLNPERVSMPDFDIDFCQSRRDEVISYVQQRYGQDRVAQITTFGELKPRAVLRDVGRVLQMPYGQVDRICKMIPNNPAAPVTLAQAIAGEPALQQMQDEEESVARLLDFGLKLENLSRHASTHAAGVVIGDTALVERIPVYRDTRSNMLVTQFDMKMSETAGLVKFDFLGLKTLTVLQKAVEFLALRGITINLETLPVEDEKTFAMLAKGDATGVFQLESSGMRDTLRRMKPDRLDDIIALVALYRPGPMDNIPKYCAVKDGREEADYLYPSLEPILKETYGIMIYQEQVMQVAQVLSGYTLGNADLLRRAMGKKIKSEMDAQRENFVSGAVARGVEAERAGFIFDQVEKFAGYGFNKSHAAAYAWISWQTAYLKANYPHEFLAALMTLDIGNTDKLSQFKQDLERLNIQLLPPDVNKSTPEFHVEQLPDGELAVRYALAALKGVGEASMQFAYAERQANGDYKSFIDFVTRNIESGLSKKQVESLIAAGAFDSLHNNRGALAAMGEQALRYAQNRRAENDSSQASLFTDQSMVPPPPIPKLPDWAPLERLKNEFGAIGFYLSAHPLDGYQKSLKRLQATRYGDLPEFLAHRSALSRLKLAGIVTGLTIKPTRKGSRMGFIALSDTSGTYEVTVFSETLATYRELLTVGSVIIFSAEAQVQEDSIRLTAHSIQLLDNQMEKLSDGLVVTLNDQSSLLSLRDILTKARTGQSEMIVRVPLDGHRFADLQLPNKFAQDSYLQHAIQSLPGVTAVEERT